MGELILVIDQGTTGSTAAFFERASLRLVANAKVEFRQHFPQPGWVEHSPDEIWASIVTAIGVAGGKLRAARGAQSVVAVGVTNQRETVVAWNRRTGEIAGPAIVWQDRRTADFCAQLGADAATRALIRRKTGLVCDPYFSASKMRWILQHNERARQWSASGELMLGTIDTFVMYKLSGGRVCVTDHTNASRTMLYDLERGEFDDDLLKLFGVRREALPEIRPSAGFFGETRGVPGIVDGVPIMGCLGDQQAALYGHECDGPGQGKVTYGTGAFYLLNTGATPRWCDHGLLTSVAASIGGERTFALEGSTFIAGAAIQFLRDNFKWFAEARLSEELALSAPRDEHVVFVPALAGLGAPYWNPHAKGALLGLTRGTSQAQITRAVLESIALQIVQLHRAALVEPFDGGLRLGVDGGASRSDFLMQFQSDVLRAELVRPANIEMTAQGAARAARRGLDPNDRASSVEPTTVFRPLMPPAEAAAIVERYLRAVAAIDAFAQGG